MLRRWRLAAELRGCRSGYPLVTVVESRGQTAPQRPQRRSALPTLCGRHTLCGRADLGRHALGFSSPKVMALVAKGRSYRLVGREVGLSKNTVAAIVKRHRAEPAQTP